MAKQFWTRLSKFFMTHLASLVTVNRKPISLVFLSAQVTIFHVEQAVQVPYQVKLSQVVEHF